MSLTWTVNFDWTTAGTFDTSRNDAARMVDYRLSRGRRDFINGSGNGLEAVEPGMLQIKLDNWDGVYDPYNTSSVLYPKVEPGRFVRVKVVDDSSVDSDNVKALLHCNGADGSTNIVDETGKAWTTTGSLKVDRYLFGGASLQGTAYTPDSDDFYLSNGDWSWEFSVTQNAGPGDYTIVDQTQDANNYFKIYYHMDPVDIDDWRIYCKQVEAGVTIWNFYAEPVAGYTIFYGSRFHNYVIGREGNTPYIFYNGKMLTVTQLTTISGKSAANLTGNINVRSFSPTDYIDEVRFVKGECAYIADYTPPSYEYSLRPSYRFTGRVDSIEKIGDVTNPQVLITAYDGLKELQNNTITTAIKAGNPHGLGTQITYLTTSAEWPAVYGTSSIGTGNAIVPYAWANEKSAFQTIKDLVDTEAGLFCAYVDGRFMFRSREATASVVTLDQSIMLKDILLTSPYKLNRNAAKVYVYDKATPEATAVKLWRMNDVPLVSTAAGLTVWGRYKYSGDECLGYDMVAPADTTDFKMNTKADGTGTDRTAKWDVTTTYFGEVSKNVISRVDAVNNHYCTLLKNRGKPIVSNESTYKIYDKAGTAAQRTLTIDSPFIQSSWQADFYDSFMTQLVATTLRFPIFQLESQPASQFEFDLFDKITVTIPKYGISGDYLVGGIDEEWITDNGQAVLTTVYTEPDIIVTPPATLVGE
jgi:hypothetical protein